MACKEWGCCGQDALRSLTSQSMEKGTFFAACLHSDKMGFTPTNHPVIFPAAFSPCLLGSGRRFLLLEHCFPHCWVFLLPSQHRVDRAEAWAEEQRLNVASERVNNHRLGVLINAIPCETEITVVCISRPGCTRSWKERAIGQQGLQL